MFDKLFNWGKKDKVETLNPPINFGRYSDNNKTVEKINKWTEADNLFKEKKYAESIDSFFEYLKDDAANNVNIKREGENFSFEIYQGSKVVRGTGNTSLLQAEVSLAKMPQPSVPVMRRLLDQNFSLYYSRYALDNDRLCMKFNTDISAANPNKLYYALKELATKADKQDDLLVQDFSGLLPLDTDHVEQIGEQEKEIKFTYFKKWITETLDYCATLDAEKFSGGIAYLLLTLSFRIDYLICPDGALLSELEKIPSLYYVKDDKPATEKNALMIDAFKKQLEKTREEFCKYIFKSKSTFAIVAPQAYKSIADAIYAANQNMVWYKENNYPYLATRICEYGISYCQYSYSLPSPLTELFLLFMKINYPGYFADLGFKDNFCEADKNNPGIYNMNPEKITAAIVAIQNKWRVKFPKLDLKLANLKYESLMDFNLSFTNEMEFLNFDNK
jgi:hypothetical protein